MEVKQEPEDPYIEEYKIDTEHHSIPSEIITKCWNYENDNIKLSSTVKKEIVFIKQEFDTDLRTENLQQTCIEPKSENSIQLSDIKQSKTDGKNIKENHWRNLFRTKMKKTDTYRKISLDADVKEEIEIVDHELKEEMDEDGGDANLFKNIDDLKLCSNDTVINEHMCYCSTAVNNTVKCKICSKDSQAQSVDRVCQMNGKLSGSECSANKHFLIHTGEKPDISSSSFRQKVNFNRNLGTRTRKKQFKCNVCTKSFSEKNHLIAHLRIHTGEKPFKCNVCAKFFSEKNHLNVHTRIHTGEKPFKCDSCTKSFSQKNHLNVHLRIHTGEKPFKCNVCTKNFSDEGNLNRHLRIHAGKKPFECNFCTKSFSDEDNLKRHLRTHTGHKPFKCDVCTKFFSQKNHLNVHLRIHTGEKPFKCIICTKSYSEKRDLKHHLCIYAGEKPFKCDVCKKSFSQERSLKFHFRFHTDEKT